MSHTSSAGCRLRDALAIETPLQVVGTINAYSALMAERVGFRAIYLSGGGVANASYGLPDIGMTTLNDVLEDVRRITSRTELPLLVDADTGWGNAFMIAKTIRQMIRAGAAGIHIEDQVQAKRCGHRPNKEIVSAAEMADRMKAAADAKNGSEFRPDGADGCRRRRRDKWCYRTRVSLHGGWRRYDLRRSLDGARSVPKVCKCG